MAYEKLIESLSPNERKILPYIKERKINRICEKSRLDKTSVLRSLEYLANKKIITLSYQKKKIVEIGVNGARYRKKGLPERNLLNLLNEKRIIGLEEAQKQSSLSDNEFKAAIGALKKKAMVEIKNEKILLAGSKEEVSKKSLEELFIEQLPLEYDLLTSEQIFALKSLEQRKDIVQIREDTLIEITPTKLGEEIILEEQKVGELIEQITPKMLESILHLSYWMVLSSKKSIKVPKRCL
jgi:phenylalanyl-tRNA synthetase alpha chain